MARVTPGELGMATPLGDLTTETAAGMEAEFADYASMGVKWLRVDFWWHVAQPNQNGSYNWYWMDKVVDLAQKYDIEIIGELNGQAGRQSWVDATFASASSRDAFAKFAGAAAAHFGDKVDYWEIWNEPNMFNITPANYTSLLKASYNAIKAVDYGDTVITGGTAATPQTGNGLWGAVDYLKQMYANGAKNYFDAVGYHPYTWPYMPDNSASWSGFQMMEDGIRGTMVANGDSSKQIWMTEVGAPTDGSSRAVSQSEQAAILKQLVDLSEDYSWAGPVLWYSYEDRGGSTSTVENWFGLLSPSGSRKQAYYTFKDLANGQSSSSTPISSPAAPSPSSSDGSATFSATNYTGSSGSNTIVGNSQSNTIWGLSGNDTISGGSGNDSLWGGYDSDVLSGGSGRDRLWGGPGNDRFVFRDLSDAREDQIMHMDSGDRIDVSGIDANTGASGDQAFSFIGTGSYTSGGQIGYYYSNGDTYVRGDVTGDRVSDFNIIIEGRHQLDAGDFVL